MTKDEALKLAKELDGVIADFEEGDGFDDVCLDTVKYVRDALLMAQPEHEPVIDKSAAVRIATALNWEPKRAWVGLTDEEIKDIIGPWGDTPIKGYTRKLFDQIEAKLRSKNT